MYLRITTYEARMDKHEEAMAKLDSLMPEIKAIPGMKHYYSTGRVEDGKCAVIAVYESREAADAAVPRARELFGQFAEYLASTPEREGYDVFAYAHMD